MMVWRDGDPWAARFVNGVRRDRVLPRTAHWRRRRLSHVHRSLGCKLGGASRTSRPERDLARFHGRRVDAVGVHHARPN
jgi:hypothetical protein